MTIKAKIDGHILIDPETEEKIELKNFLGYTVVDYDEEKSIIFFENLP